MITRIVYEEDDFGLTEEEELVLQAIAPEYDSSRIDGIIVHWLSSDTIEEFIADEQPTGDTLKVLRSLDAKIKACLGEDFETFDFIIQSK